MIGVLTLVEKSLGRGFGDRSRKLGHLGADAAPDEAIPVDEALTGAGDQAAELGSYLKSVTGKTPADTSISQETTADFKQAIRAENLLQKASVACNSMTVAYEGQVESNKAEQEKNDVKEEKKYATQNELVDNKKKNLPAIATLTGLVNQVRGHRKAEYDKVSQNVNDQVKAATNSADQCKQELEEKAQNGKSNVDSQRSAAQALIAGATKAAIRIIDASGNIYGDTTSDNAAAFSWTAAYKANCEVHTALQTCGAEDKTDSFEGHHAGTEDHIEAIERGDAVAVGALNTLSGEYATRGADFEGCYQIPGYPYGGASEATQLRVFDATQSTLSRWGGPAWKAIDGNRSQKWRDQSCTHTQNNAKEFWQGDLRKTKRVYQLRIYNRTDACGGCRDRLQGASIKVCTDTEGLTCGICDASLAYSANSEFVFNIQCGPAVEGRYVRIELENKHLTLCEVEVFGTDVETEAYYNSKANGTCTRTEIESCDKSVHTDEKCESKSTCEATCRQLTHAAEVKGEAASPFVTLFDDGACSCCTESQATDIRENFRPVSDDKCDKRDDGDETARHGGHAGAETTVALYKSEATTSLSGTSRDGGVTGALR